MTAEAVTDTRLASTVVQRRRQGADGGAPDVGLRRHRHRQSVHRHHGRRGADPRRFRVELRVPAAECRHRIAEGGAPLHQGHRPVEVREGEGADAKWARLEPYHGFKLSFEIGFRPSRGRLDRAARRVRSGLRFVQPRHSRARAPSASPRRSSTCAPRAWRWGGGLDNAIVMDDTKVLNAGGLRYDDEFVKHKILDAMGDLYIVGKPLLAAYSAFRSGHALNNRAAARTAAQQGRLGTRDLRRREARTRRLRRNRTRLVGRGAARCCCSAGSSCCCCWVAASRSRSMRAPGSSSTAASAGSS